jgi:hypothetical protein
MSQPSPATHEDLTTILNGLGVPVTTEGKARAGRRLAQADDNRDHAARNALLERLRRPATAA